MKAVDEIAQTISQDRSESSLFPITSSIVQAAQAALVTQAPIVQPAEADRAGPLTGTDVLTSTTTQLHATSTTCEMFSAYKARVNLNIDEEKNHPRSVTFRKHFKFLNPINVFSARSIKTLYSSYSLDWKTSPRTAN